MHGLNKEKQILLIARQLELATGIFIKLELLDLEIFFMCSLFRDWCTTQTCFDCLFVAFTLFLCCAQSYYIAIYLLP